MILAVFNETLEKQAVSWIWPLGCSWPAPVLEPYLILTDM